MSKTPWVFAVVSTVISTVLGLANIVARIGVTGVWTWLQPAARYLYPDAIEWIWFLTLLGAAVPLVANLFGGHEFKKEKSQRILDHLAKEVFDGDTKLHRLTLFRAVRGYRVWFGILFHRLWHQDEMLITLKSLLRVLPLGLYLYPWARPKKSTNPYSCSVWRVFRAKKRDCQGVAGLVWVKDTYTLSSVSNSFAPGQLRRIRPLDRYAATNPIRKYAEGTNVHDASQLRMLETYASHFHGMVIEDNDGVKWGVMLLDSSAESCPIPEGERGDTKANEFRRYAELLSNILT